MNWIEEENKKIHDLIERDGNCIVAIPSDQGHYLNVYDLYDNRTHEFIIRNLSDHDANIAVTVCNNLINDKIDVDLKNLRWLFSK